MSRINEFLQRRIVFISPLLIFSCLFLTQIIPLSPFYFGIALSFFLLLCIFSCNKDVKLFAFQPEELVVFISILLLSLYVLIMGFVFKSSFKDIVLNILGYSFYFFAFPIFSIQKEEFNKILKIFIWITIVLFICEMIYRMSHPSVMGYTLDSSNFFYMFKWNSIIFSDTNETGFLELIFFSFLLFLKNECVFNIKKKYLLLVGILIIFTFSRAAMLAMFALLFYEYIFRKLNVFYKFFIVFGMFFIIILAFIIFVNDASFLTKLDIYEKTLNYIQTSGLKQFLFGNGMYNSQYVLGIYGHNYFTLYLVEFGFIGVVLYLMVFLLIFAKCHKVYYILISYFIAGLSYAPYFIPYVYFFMGIICIIEKERNVCRKYQ